MCFAHQPAEPLGVRQGLVEEQQRAQLAHDALLALQPIKAEHAVCALCPDPVINKEVAQVVDAAERTYTEAEHLALMADAVKRETANLTESKEGVEAKVSTLTAQVDVLEGEKAALETKVADAEKALAEFKAEVERAQEVESAKKERVEAVKAANAQLPETYFTEDRVLAWAEMPETTFAVVLDGLTAAAATSGGGIKETAAFSGGATATAGTKPSVGRLFAARRGEK